MLCRVTMCVSGVRTQTLIIAPSSIDALLAALNMVPESAAVRAIVAVIKPEEAH